MLLRDTQWLSARHDTMQLALFHVHTAILSCRTVMTYDQNYYLPTQPGAQYNYTSGREIFQRKPTHSYGSPL